MDVPLSLVRSSDWRSVGLSFSESPEALINLALCSPGFALRSTRDSPCRGSTLLNQIAFFGRSGHRKELQVIGERGVKKTVNLFFTEIVYLLQDFLGTLCLQGREVHKISAPNL